MSDILVINAGSSSIKFALFDAQLESAVEGSATAIGAAHSRLTVNGAGETLALSDHVAALRAILAALAARGVRLDALRAAAHRVVHGGRELTAPALVDDTLLAAVERCSPLAPLHNPHNLSAIRALAAVAPDLPQVACFDTAFHAGAPEEALRYALAPEAEALGIRRYGFHGLSYESLTRRLPEISGALPRRLLACHLGAGASLCAIRDGRSVATTMGYSPLSGLTMALRTGDIDGAAVLRMVEAFGAERAGAMLNGESGLLGLSGISADMRALEESDAPEAAFAIRHFCYWTARHAGSMIAAMDGIDAIAFTGGIGENGAAIRADILRRLAWTGLEIDEAAQTRSAVRLTADASPVTAWVVPAEEEAMIARHARELLATTPVKETL